MPNNPATHVVRLDASEHDHAVNVNGAFATTGEADVVISSTNDVGIYEVDWDGSLVPVFVETNGVDIVQVSFRGYSFSGRVLREQHHALLAVLNASPTLRSRSLRVLTPMPGLLKMVHTTEGEEVRKGQTLFTLEAMKMENSITSPIHGIVQEVVDAVGQALEKGHRLCTIVPITV